ncbi:MBL fold metallo-hydrolase [Marinifilum fragile]|uniref:MBL fold metallo-hydrolase n=1 Tax=Marinifilum fragile TaxID=570161 RepID=UPI002AA7BA75|nr:MBL fold metallo-hydrolase [Marinifilum fragile]
MKIHRLINSFYSSNTYILYNDSNKAYIVDCGDAFEIIDWFKRNNKTLEGVFLTHTHFDHINGLNDLLKEFKQLKIYTSSFGKLALFDERKNLSRYHEKPFIYCGDNILILENEDSIFLWDECTLNVYQTLGHDKSCLTFSVDNYLFTGDSHIPGIKVVSNLPNSNKDDAKISEKFIISLITRNTITCPGHGDIIGNIY